MVVGSDGTPVGVQAVIDKDLTAELLARTVDADRLVILTDVDAVMREFGTPSAEPVDRIDVASLRGLHESGAFPAGSMGPKVEAVARFVEETGGTAAIGHLDRLAEVVAGLVGTQVEP